MYLMEGSRVLPYRGIYPDIAPGVLVASGAAIIGDVRLGEDASVWFNTVIRGDCNYIRIGARTNIQDGSVIHVTHDTAPTHIEEDVTIGHGAVIHGCTIKRGSLIGMGAILLDHAVIPEDSFVAAGALVPPGKSFEPGMMIMGSPAKAVRRLTAEETKSLKESVQNYLQYKASYEKDRP